MIAEQSIESHLDWLDEALLANQIDSALTQLNEATKDDMTAEKIITSDRKTGIVYGIVFNWMPNATYEYGFMTPWASDLNGLVEETIHLLEVLPMNIFSTALFEFLSGEMIGDKMVTMTIKDVKLKEINNGRNEEIKPIVTFEERKKKWVLNKTSARALAENLGAETNAWKGSKVILHAPHITAFGRTMRAIRVYEVLPVGQVASTETVAEPSAQSVNGEYSYQDANADLLA